MTITSQPGAEAQAKARPAASTALIRVALLLLVPLMTIAPSALAQALPAAEASTPSTGFALPRAEGTLRYAVSASETLTWGYYGAGAASASNLSGDLAYLSSSKTDPFSMIFSGGHSWSTSNQPSYTFLNLALSQVITTRLWNFIVADSVSYLPSTPTAGLSGIPGFGDLGAEPVPSGGYDGQGVLTNYSTRVSNAASGTLAINLTGKTSLNGTGVYAITRFLGDSGGYGLDSTQETGGGGLTHRFNVRNSLGGNYSYATYTYQFAQPGFTTQTGTVTYTRQFTRKFNSNISVGPQWTNLNLPGSVASLNLYAQAVANYAGRFSHATLGFIRSANGGYGVIAGTVSNSVHVSVGRTFARVWNCAASAAYSRASNLTGATGGSFSSDTTVGGGQVSRALGRSFSAYASYTLENQSNSGSSSTVDLYTGRTQVAGFGLTFSPSPFHPGRQ
jgi:hypothetical protein